MSYSLEVHSHCSSSTSCCPQAFILCPGTS